MTGLGAIRSVAAVARTGLGGLEFRSDGTIVRIVNALPMDLTPLPSGEPIIGVLEIRGGRAAELGIKEGDIASWTR